MKYYSRTNRIFIQRNIHKVDDGYLLDTTLAKEVKMVTQIVQEIYGSISTVSHTPTAREMVDAMIVDGYTLAVIQQQLTKTYVGEKKAEKEANGWVI